MSILKTVATSKAARAGVALSLTGAALVASASSSSAVVAAVKLTVAPATGADTGATLAVTGSGFTDAAGASLVYSNASGIQFNSATACPSAPATAAAGSVYDVSTKAVVSATRLVVTAPAMSLGTASAPKTYQLCVYANATTLLGSGKYTIYAAPTITAANTPASGASAGGNSVVISGTGFTSKSVVKFGSVVSPKITVAKDGLSITAVAPPQAAGAVAVSVTTEGGANPTPGTATWDDYTYTNAVTVTPKLGKNASATNITVTGVGFRSLNFVTTAAVAFVPGAYVKATHGVGGTAPAALCTAVQVISDTELVCTTPTTVSDTPLIVTVLGDKATAATTPNASVVSSSAAFTFAAF